MFTLTIDRNKLNASGGKNHGNSIENKVDTRLICITDVLRFVCNKNLDSSMESRTFFASSLESFQFFVPVRTSFATKRIQLSQETFQIASLEEEFSFGIRIPRTSL